MLKSTEEMQKGRKTTLIFPRNRQARTQTGTLRTTPTCEARAAGRQAPSKTWEQDLTSPHHSHPSSLHAPQLPKTLRKVNF